MSGFEVLYMILFRLHNSFIFILTINILLNSIIKSLKKYKSLFIHTIHLHARGKLIQIQHTLNQVLRKNGYLYGSNLPVENNFDTSKNIALHTMLYKISKILTLTT